MTLVSFNTDLDMTKLGLADVACCLLVLCRALDPSCKLHAQSFVMTHRNMQIRCFVAAEVV